MSALSFIARIGAAKVGDAQENLKAALIAHNPDVASQLDIDDLTKIVHDLGLEIASAEQEEETNHQAVTKLETTLGQTQQAATLIGNRLETATTANDTAQVTVLTTQLTKLLDEIQKVAGAEGDGSKSGTLYDAIMRHHASEERLHKRQELHAGATANLSAAQNKLAGLKDALKDATLAEQAAERERADAERLAGITSRVNSVGSVAADAMQKRVDELNKRTRAAQLDAAAMGNMSGASTADLVAQTLAEANAPTPMNALDRLKALQGKNAA